MTTKPAATVRKKELSGTLVRMFDARPDRLDFRDLPYRPPLRSLPPLYPLEADVDRLFASFVAEDLVLNQGNQGACTGFGLAGVANFLLWTRHLESKHKLPFVPVSPRMLYELAKRYDEWPGVDYVGSSCRGALKGWHKHGVCAESHWPYHLGKRGAPLFSRPQKGWEVDAAMRPLGVYYRVVRESVVDLQAAIVNIGAVYVSGGAHDGWDSLADFDPKQRPPKRHADLPVIPPVTKRRSVGGHAFALVGYNQRGFIVQNSWGRSWGAGGFAVLPYEDWVVHGTDAWACALGVPVTLHDALGQPRALSSTRWRVPSGGSLSALDRSATAPGNPPEDPWPIDHAFKNPLYQPWSTDAAYSHTLVTGNNGELVATDMTRVSDDKAGLAREIVFELPRQWARAKGQKTLKLALYAHGGLNNEDESIRRIRVLAPYFEANGVYPLFLTWKTGAGETLQGLAQDWARKLFGEEASRSGGILDALGDAKDRAVEALAHVLGRGLWTEMRDNAAHGADSGHGLDLLAQHLIALDDDLRRRGGALELHLVGHSAGSILLGHFLAKLRGPRKSAPLLRVQTCSLFAAACSARFAMDRYAGAAAASVLELSRLWLHVLSDANEKADGLPSPSLPAYGKSLLYLVSRALDDARKMPLLGMERTLLPTYAKDTDQWDAGELVAVQAWQAAWPGANAGLLGTVATPKLRNTREGNQIDATHGSFDNNIEVLTATIERIAQQPLVSEMEWLDY